MGQIACFGKLVFIVAAICLSTPCAAREGNELTRLVEAWLASPHGNYHSESFTHWNKDGKVPERCAACHSQPGIIDYLGADGSLPGKVDKPAAINAPIGCASCHTEAAHKLNSVTFPSGAKLSGMGRSSVCNVCHQGRRSSDDVTNAVVSIGEDTVSSCPPSAFTRRFEANREWRILRSS
ncbi:MAG: hypothetical protein RLZ98_3768 [Pseudomonadota bacterium]